MREKIKNGFLGIAATCVVSSSVCSALRQFDDDCAMPEDFSRARWEYVEVQGEINLPALYAVQELNFGRHLIWDNYLNAVLKKNRVCTAVQLDSLGKANGEILLPSFRRRK